MFHAAIVVCVGFGMAQAASCRVGTDTQGPYKTLKECRARLNHMETSQKTVPYLIKDIRDNAGLHDLNLPLRVASTCDPYPPPGVKNEHS